MNCICIDPAKVTTILPMVDGLLREAMQNGHGDFADIEHSILNGDKLLWIAVDEKAIWAAAVTGLHEERGRRFCCIWACGGREKDRWLSFRDKLEKFAKEEHCAFMRIYGRRGWAREFPDYKLTQVVLEKDLS